MVEGRSLVCRLLVFGALAAILRVQVVLVQMAFFQAALLALFHEYFEGTFTYSYAEAIPEARLLARSSCAFLQLLDAVVEEYLVVARGAVYLDTDREIMLQALAHADIADAALGVAVDEQDAASNADSNDSNPDWGPC